MAWNEKWNGTKISLWNMEDARIEWNSSVSTRELDHIPGEPHGYLLRSLTPAYWPSVDFSDVAALSNSNIQRTVFYKMLSKTESNRQQNII